MTTDAVASVRSAPAEQVPAGAPAPTSILGPAPPEGLYLHVPFCVSRCPYCDFVVYAGAATRGPRARIGALLEAMHVELGLRADEADARFGPPGEGRQPLSSLYLGGGTPSLLAPAAVAGLIEHARRRFGLAGDAEVTLEANPGADEIGDLEGFAAAGVNRVSIGAQSMDRTELRSLGRRHGPDDVVAAVVSARKAGLRAVCLDLLIDTPGQTVESWRATLRAALALEPDHLSIYDLSLDDPEVEGLTGPEGDHLPPTKGALAWRARARARQTQERTVHLDVLTDELTSAAGLRRYEIANLAHPGWESRHNLLYWRRRPYLGVGPGAHSSDGHRTRRWNGPLLERYIEALFPEKPGIEAALPPGGAEVVDTATARAEAAMLALRLSEGLPKAVAADPLIAPGLAWALGEGLIEPIPGRLRLTTRGRALSNEVFLRLLPQPGNGQEPASARSVADD